MYFRFNYFSTFKIEGLFLPVAGIKSWDLALVAGQDWQDWRHPHSVWGVVAAVRGDGRAAGWRISPPAGCGPGRPHCTPPPRRPSSRVSQPADGTGFPFLGSLGRHRIYRNYTNYKPGCRIFHCFFTYKNFNIKQSRGEIWKHVYKIEGKNDHF